MIAVPKRLVVAGGIAVLVIACLWLADRNGYNRASTKFNAAAAQAAEAAKQKQAAEQKVINDLAGQFYKAAENLQIKSSELNRLKSQLRSERYVEPDPECRCLPGRVLPAVYRMHNAAADNRDLPQAVGTIEPDEAGDGIEVVQYSVTEYNRIAVQLNTLQAVIRESACFEQ